MQSRENSTQAVGLPADVAATAAASASATDDKTAPIIETQPMSDDKASSLPDTSSNKDDEKSLSDMSAESIVSASVPQQGVPETATSITSTHRPTNEAEADPSRHVIEKAEAEAKAVASQLNADATSSTNLPAFPTLPPSNASTNAAPLDASVSADNMQTSADNAEPETTDASSIPSPSATIAKRPKPGASSSSKLRAAQMPNNPNRGAAASEATSGAGSSNNTPTTPLRRGKWTVEEEEYAALVIQMFNAGYLPAPAGTTLRAYLSDKLHCDPMRITKKFTGASCIGKRVFHPAVRCAENSAAIDSAQEELVNLEARWRKRLKLKKSSSKKSQSRRKSDSSGTSASPPSTSAASAGMSAGYRPPAVSPPSEQWSADSSSITHTGPSSGGIAANSTQIPPVQHGSSWIDRAQALLGNESNGPSSENSYSRRKVSDTSNTSSYEGKPTSSTAAATTVTPSEAKDAEALVGFLNSVRAEAASGSACSGTM